MEDGGDLAPGDVLDELGLTFVRAEGADGEGEGERVFVDGPTENLGVRLVMWGMRVVQDDGVEVLGEDGVREVCLFVRGREGGGGGGWWTREG